MGFGTFYKDQSLAQIFPQNRDPETPNTRSESVAAMFPLGKKKGGKVTIQVERQVKEGEKLDSLWVYIVDEETG